MLVLSRKVNEKIVINDEIIITIFEVRKDRVRLGIEAPQEYHIDRPEWTRGERGRNRATGEQAEDR